jgi:hypothetical protein
VHTADDRSTVLVEAGAWSDPGYLGAASPPRMFFRPRTRKEVDVALHGIGLVIDDLLDDVRVPEPEVTRELAAPPELDVHAKLLALLADTKVDLRRIEIAVEGEHVTLRGSVDDALARLLVEDLAWSLPDVRECDNELAIVGRRLTGDVRGASMSA